ncbi:Cytochrome P450 [Myxococcus fulvus]|uniref:Cytochrome P450 n=1 Tax=Myxococcus fulvus TaxID=33 RepID=A0A511TE36_MYXFU|nr:cytochrome P450 [Myxococcus fulvus]GEN12429.1 cytochrome P450 [Myxococcus fulvus]SET76299.1 Cytochrome P450 [Myxococcus fulvus]
MGNRLDLLSREYLESPHAHLTELRRRGPVVQVDPGGMWLVTRYEEAQQVLKSASLFSSQGLRASAQPAWLQRVNPFADSLLFLDPPQHGRLRALVSRAFAPAALARLEARIRGVAREHVAGMMNQKNVDFVDAFAMPIPATVMGWLLGLDASLHQRFNRWANDLVTMSGVRPEDTGAMARYHQTLEEMERYFQGVLDDRRDAPRDDMASDLLRAQVEGEALTNHELLSFLYLLLVAGLETTVNLLNQCALVFSQHPELLLRLREDPALIPRFIEETLRYEPSVMATLRLCTQDVTLAGVELPRGALVLVSLASANRDEKYFPDGDRFILEREGPQRLSFGHGPHFCMGAMLSRLEARVALEEFVSRVERLELRTDHLDWTTALLVRGPVTLPVEVFAPESGQPVTARIA